MAEIAGATKLGLNLEALFKSVRKSMEDSQLRIREAAADLVAEVENGGSGVVKALRAEQANVRATFTAALGNAINETEEPKGETVVIKPGDVGDAGQILAGAANGSGEPLKTGGV